MRILIIVSSKHRQNTLKIAEAMAETAPVEIVDIEHAQSYNPDEYDIVGFGSGVYAGKFDKRIIEYADKLSERRRCTFVFSTSGTGKFRKYNAAFVNLLKSKNKIILGNFGCRGLCKWFIFALVGGISKGHPDASDYAAAQEFINEVIDKYEDHNR